MTRFLVFFVSSSNVSPVFSRILQLPWVLFPLRPEDVLRAFSSLVSTVWLLRVVVLWNHIRRILSMNIIEHWPSLNQFPITSGRRI